MCTLNPNTVFKVGYQHFYLYMTCYENFLQETKKRHNTCAVFCGLTKTIDTLHLERLLRKLDHPQGIRGLTHKLSQAICKTDSSILLLVSYLGGNYWKYPEVIAKAPTLCFVHEWSSWSIKLNSYVFCWWYIVAYIFCWWYIVTYILYYANSANSQNGVNSELQKVNDWM